MVLGLVGLVGLALALLAGACGGGETSDDPVVATQERLGKLDEVDLHLRLTAASGADNTGGDVGFALEGPFAAPTKDGRLPVARLTATRLLGDKTETSTFVADGADGWVETADGKRIELTEAQLDSLRASTDEGAADLGGLHLDRWFATRETKVEGDTTTVAGELDTPEAINDVFALAGALGTGTEQPRLEGKDAERLTKLVRTATVELVTTTDEHDLRSLRFDVRFGAADQAKVAELLPEFAGVRLAFELKLNPA